ncbi:MAG: dicarboxylate/amino acid:cation symporter [Gammaproteobacteria bacterium]|nr:dicarboxylate/amino acid:cation symporter [Gammaproteobacteria bacterium]
MTLTIRILIAMGLGLVLGSLVKAAGLDADHWIQSILIGDFIDAGGQIFVRSLRLMVVPLVFVSLICGAASLGASGNMGRVAGKAVGLYLLTTAIAISIALMLALLVEPGVGLTPMELESSFDANEPESFKNTLINIFPTNPVEAMARGNMLQIIVFALLLGVALSHSGEAGNRITKLFQDLNEILMKLITMLIELAPYGVFCLMTELFATLGLAEIVRLVQYFLTVVAALLIHVTLVYPALLMLLGRVSPVRFFLKMREPMLVAFSTASSSATLPVTLRTVKERIGVKNEVASFAVPLGATINMDGTAIMQGVATVFIAQLYGIELGLSEYLMVILTATMASIGTAGVPGVGMIMLVMVLEQVGLPLEGIVFILAVDRLLDMLRTAVNVSGDGMVATIVARSEDDLDMAVFEDPAAGRAVGR